MSEPVFTPEQEARIRQLLRDELAPPTATDVGYQVRESLRRIAAKAHIADMSEAQSSVFPGVATSPE